MGEQLYWWMREYYLTFDPMDDGYPHPGQVIQYYRQHTLIEGKCWTQIELANYLDLTGMAVWCMENQNISLDSFERRTTLAKLFGIPPILLKLQSASPVPEQQYPGQIVRAYRRKKRDSDGKRWSQSDVAQALDITERSVRAMENDNTGLDSLSRREALVRLLGIPPLLLGLDLSRSLFNGTKQEALAPAISQKAWQNEEKLLQYQALVPQYRDAYLTASSKTGQFTLLGKVEEAIASVRQMAPYLKSDQQPLVPELLCHYHGLASSLEDNLGNPQVALSHSTLAVTVAQSMNQQDLLAAALYWRGFDKWNKGDVSSAAGDVQSAISFTSGRDVQLKAMVLLEAGHFLSYNVQERVETLQVHQYLDQAEYLVHQKSFDQDIAFVRLDKGRFHIGKAATLLQLRRFTDTLDELDRAERLTTAEQLRRRAWIDVLRAKTYFAQGDADFATEQALTTLPICMQIHSRRNIADIAQLCSDLKQSSYGASPDVARLDLMLQGRE